MNADEWKWAACDLAPEIAQPYGGSPLSIGPETVSRGVGVIALTPYGVVQWLYSPVVVLARFPWRVHGE